ncbi:MAG: GNAT family N-acetyltransferase [Candidatus Limnocylindrales bacterium]
MDGRRQLKLRLVASDDLTAAQVARLRELMLDAFEGDEHGGFTDDDWQHALGGTHFLLEAEGEIVCHASVVTRELHVDGVPLMAAYVEAVATDPGQQGHGLGTQVMRAVGDFIDSGDWQIAALGTGSQAFYERLGWRIWRGPSFVRTGDADQPTPTEDDYIMVRLTPRSPAVRWDAPISCEWRPGDVW